MSCRNMICLSEVNQIFNLDVLGLGSKIKRDEALKENQGFEICFFYFSLQKDC